MNIERKFIKESTIPKGYDLLLLGGSVGGPTSEKNQNSVAFNPILLNNITF